MYVDKIRDEKRESSSEFIPLERRLPATEELKRLPLDVLARWQAPEHEIREKDRKWYLYVSCVLLAIIIYAVYTNSPVMAITFILIGMVGYIFLSKEPRIIDFVITPRGIVAGREIYEFENIESFWIFYEPNHLKVISLHMKHKLLPYTNIPVHEEDPVEIRALLMEYIPEIKQEPGIADALERFIGL